MSDLSTMSLSKLQARAEELNTRVYWESVERFIAQTPDAELAARKEEVLPTLSPQVQELVKHRDVRNSKILKGAIYNAAVPA